jgi:predicted DNA-binding transcriptional regulator YafY
MGRTPFVQLDALVQALLRESIPRKQPEPLEFTGQTKPIDIEEPGERAVAAVGALLVWKLIQHGGSKLPVGPAARAANQLVESFSEVDRHRLEQETAEILRWLEDALNLLGDDWEEVEERGMYPWEDREFPCEKKMETLRRAIHEKADLEVEYFTYRRNSMSRRRVTPLEIQDERILRARCHWREDERSFAIHRIKEARFIAVDAPRTEEIGGTEP